MQFLKTKYLDFNKVLIANFLVFYAYIQIFFIILAIGIFNQSENSNTMPDNFKYKYFIGLVLIILAHILILSSLIFLWKSIPKENKLSHKLFIYLLLLLEQGGVLLFVIYNPPFTNIQNLKIEINQILKNQN